MAQVEPPRKGRFDSWKAEMIKELHYVVFRCFPERIPAAKVAKEIKADDVGLESEPGIEVRLEHVTKQPSAKRLLLVVRGPDSDEPASNWLQRVSDPGDTVCICTPRGVGPTRWTRKNPPNYVERSHVLLGRTVDTGRVWDVIATARYLHDKYDGRIPIYVAGEGAAGILAAYAALWEQEISGVMASNPPISHMDDEAPQFLNVLRVCDIPDILGMLAPRPLTVYSDSDALEKVTEFYSAAGADNKLDIR
jgi:hypothetical protein